MSVSSLALDAVIGKVIAAAGLAVGATIFIFTRGSKLKPCKMCGGMGGWRCAICNGSGVVIMNRDAMKCKGCAGHGKRLCRECSGSGWDKRTNYIG